MSIRSTMTGSRAVGTVALVVAMLALLTMPSVSRAADRSALGCDTALPAGVVDGPAWHDELVRLVNDHRSARGLATVQSDAVLSRSATWKARDVIARGYGGHDDPGRDGRPSRTSQDRAQTCGFTSGYASENLQKPLVEVSSPRQVIDAWLASPGHRANIERPEWRYVGTGIARSATPMPDGAHESAYDQQFSSVPAPASPRCGTVTLAVWVASRTSIDPRLCRTEGGAELYGAAPAFGQLVGVRYAAPRRVGMVRFTVRWPDTGVIQPVEIYVRPAASRAIAGRVSCSAARRCTLRYTLRRPVVASRALLQVQRRSGSRWAPHRAIVLTRASGAATVALSRGTYRVRVVIARHPIQYGSASSWQARRL